MIDTYRRSVQRKQDEISKLHIDKAKEIKKDADLASKIQKAKEAINRTKTQSTIKSKVNEIGRHQTERANVAKRIASIEEKIARKQKELGTEQGKLAREEEKEAKKRSQEIEKQERKQKKRMSEMNSTLAKHDRLHVETKTMLERIPQLPEKIVVLFLASNPVDQKQLRLDDEARSIAEMIRKTKHRDSVKLESCWAVQPMDILQAINEHCPAIVHFSGHGSDQDEIVFQDANGNTKLVSKEAIVQTMMASSDSIRLVFFNTCYSKNQAVAVVEHVEAAIGMNTSIGDNAACVFASQFYSAIGFGLSVQKAFEQGKAMLMLEGIKEEDTPELFVHDGINPEELIIVKP